MKVWGWPTSLYGCCCVLSLRVSDSTEAEIAVSSQWPRCFHATTPLYYLHSIILNLFGASGGSAGPLRARPPCLELELLPPRIMGSLHVYDEFRGHKASQNTHGDIAHLPLGPCAQPVANQTTFVWLQTVLAHAGSRSQEALIKLLRGRKSHPDKTASVLNQARSLIAKVFPFIAPNKPNAGDSLRKASACEQLFKLCLHRVLLLALDEAASLQGVSSPADLGEAIFFAAVASVLSKNEVLDGLAQGCIEIVVFAHLTSPQDSFPAASMRMGRSTQWVELLQGLVWVRHSKIAIQGATLEEGTIPGLPGNFL